MSNVRTSDNAMENWAMALACAPHVLQGATIDSPDMIQRLADSSASLHGLVAYVRENYDTDDSESALLDWDIDLLAGASSFLYRNLGLSEDATIDRMHRLSGAMKGTAKYMEGCQLDTLKDVRRQAKRTPPLAA